MTWRHALLLICLLQAAPAAAQRLPAGAATPRAAAAPSVRGEPAPAPWPAAAVLASAVLPGAGQWLQGQSRWVPYVALEIWSWLRFRERREDSRRLTEQYRDRAWQVARRVSVGERRDTVFEYYEALADAAYGSSGAWDASPFQEGLQPEQDPGTFNGQVWSLARSLFFPGGQVFLPGSSQYENALGYYRQHAVPPQYAWAWASRLEQQVFADLIVDSDDAYRDGTRMLGIILANHVASAVDALITARLRALATNRAELRSELVPAGPGASLRTQVRITF